jgi:DNA invertase Pin-like site-specific DNA recombinase
MAGMAAVFAEWERGMIGLRIREALAEKRAAGWDPTAGPERRRAVLRLHRRGLSQRAIAAELELHKRACGAC